jgi:hypothetical protein
MFRFRMARAPPTNTSGEFEMPRGGLCHLSAFAVAVLAMAGADAFFGLAHAQGTLDAQYSVTLGGIPFGKGTWRVDIREDQFTAAMSGGTTGLLQLFARGKGTSAVRGTVAQGQPHGVTYVSTIETDKKYDEVRMVMNGNVVKDFQAEPPSTPTPTRIPITEAHRRGVSDPMTAALIRAPGSGDVFAPELCQRKLAIFDGRMRYDLKLAYKRLDKVRSEKGYQGTVVVCAVYFAPVAGHVPERSAIKYLTELRDTEVALAPVAGTRLMVPFRVSLPTPFGLGVLQATQFVSIPHPPLSSPGSVKTQ